MSSATRESPTKKISWSDGKQSGDQSFFQRFVARSRRKTPSPHVDPQHRPGLLATVFGSPVQKFNQWNKKSQQQTGLKEPNPNYEDRVRARLERQTSQAVTSASVAQDYEVCDEFMDINTAACDTQSSTPSSGTPVMQNRPMTTAMQRSLVASSTCDDIVAAPQHVLKTEIRVVFMGPQKIEKEPVQPDATVQPEKGDKNANGRLKTEETQVRKISAPPSPNAGTENRPIPAARAKKLSMESPEQKGIEKKADSGKLIDR